MKQNVLEPALTNFYCIVSGEGWSWSGRDDDGDDGGGGPVEPGWRCPPTLRYPASQQGREGRLDKPDRRSQGGVGVAMGRAINFWGQEVEMGGRMS